MRGFSAGLLGALFAGLGVAQAQDSTMAVPGNYRDWVFLTSSMDLNYTTTVAPGQHMLDNVYVNPEAHKVFLATGTWPDKTILIKENRFAESAGTLSKAGHFQAAVRDVEIHIKDEARFPGKWAFFKSDDGKAAGKLQPQTATCYACHQDHAAVDTTFVQFYPTLFGIAKAKGTLSAAYLKETATK